MATTTAPEPLAGEPTSTERGLFVDAKRWWAAHPALAQQLRGFAVVAVICTVISMTMFSVLRPSVGTQWANVISLVSCSVLNTELNRRLSFGIKSAHLWWQDHRRGLWVMLLALVMTSGSLWLLQQISPNASIVMELSFIVLGNVASAVMRFVLMRYWIFRRARHGKVHGAAARESGVGMAPANH